MVPLASAGQPVPVRPLPWPVVELLVATLRKLAHDLTNSMVAGVSMVDLTLLKCNEPAVADSLNRLRSQVLRPRATLARATASLPMPSADRPNTIDALAENISALAEAGGIQLLGAIATTPWPAERPRQMEEGHWVHILHVLLQNAIEAHAAAAMQSEPPLDGKLPYVRVDLTTQPGGGLRLLVTDNGEGCADLRAAATGGMRRSGNGHLGLGLAVAAAIAERGGGKLAIAHNPPRGTLAVAEFPPGLTSARQS